MIELRTGLPRNGKTLSMVVELALLQAGWDAVKRDNKGSGGRAVYTNINGLALPHLPIPVKGEQLSREGLKTLVPDWDAIPDGSLVIFDEAQEWFPPRSTQMQAPAHVAFLSVHGHRGLDLVFITQHPKLVDFALRALVGKHKHYRRVFGFNKAAVYEWDACSDNLGGMKNATMGYFQFPKSGFGLYTSASEHTPQKFKLPLWFGIPILGVVLCLFFIPRAYSILVHGPDHSATAGKDGKPGSASAPAEKQVAGSVAPETAPVSPLVATSAAAVSAPGGKHYLGCIAKAGRCACLLDTGEMKDDADQCQKSAEGYTGRMALLASSGVSLPPSLRPVAVDKDSRGAVVLPSEGFGALGRVDGVRQVGQAR